ncbi:hypothetical protein ABZ470_34510 [Streptosporangium sp. NPDC020072]|uniref:Uncharacterized protein n=1 Tax=Streptosporangium jomthongense TaxID=1193683 RepID=A0ABV8EYW8_9ACTN
MRRSGGTVMVLITVRLPPQATLEQATHRLGLRDEEVDLGYDLVLIDPRRGLYGLRVTEAAADRISPVAFGGTGPHSDPRIEPYGPPR